LPESLITRFIVSLPVFLLAITLHEVGHAYVAYLCGDDTAKRAGRLTLSPIAHLDPLGTLLFVVSSLAGGIGFGWAKPVPVAVGRMRNPRRDDILVSLAGVTANLLQAIAWSLLLRAAEAYLSGSFGAAVATLCFIGVVMNVVLMIFNLLPIPPLDGSHVALNLLGIHNPYTIMQFSRIGMLVLFLFVSTGIFGAFFGAIVEPVIRLFLR